MNKATIVVFLLLFCSSTFASPLSDSINRIESDWAVSYYLNTPEQQKTDYPELLDQVREIGRQFPHATEPKIWEAILLSANASYQPPITALESIDKAKKLLELAIAAQPEALEGAAYVTLGTLYYMVPGWPISFGDNDKAEHLLKKGLELNPDGIDANYFYGDFMLSQGKLDEAEKYFKSATQASIRRDQILADLQLKKVASLALSNTRQKLIKEGKSKRLPIFSSNGLGSRQKYHD